MPAIKALILAAGFGSRMQPITDLIPKPMIPFMGKPLIEHAIKKIRDAGIEKIAVNGHHLFPVLKEYLSKNHKDIYLSYEPSILGTGGAIYPLKDFLDGDDLLIFNSDVLCNIDLKKFIADYQKRRDFASMLLLKNPDLAKTAIAMDSYQKLKAFGSILEGCSHHSFTGIHIISHKMVQMVGEGFSSIIDTYKECLANGLPIGCFLHDGFWKDLGTPKDFYGAHKDFLAIENGYMKAHGLSQKEGSVLDDRVRLYGGSILEDSFLFGETEIGEHAKVSESVVMDGKVKSHARVEGQIVYRHLNIQFD